MIDKLLKAGLIVKLYYWIKPRILGLGILIGTVFAINYFHSEYISWVEISGKKLFLGYSYLIKNSLIVMSLIIYFYINKKKSSNTNNLKDKSLDNKQKSTFEKLKAKGKLKTEYERILEGSDDKE